MAGGINIQASDGKYVNINFEAGAVDNVAMTVPKEGGKAVVADAAGTVTISTAGQGLKLPNASSTDATTLDWYEEGTFTPIIIGATTAGVGTYNIQLGKYTRIGDIVNISIYLTISAHTGTGDMVITGLPFINSTAYVYATSLTVSSLTFTGIPTAVILPSSSYIKLYSQVSNTVLTAIPMDTACTMYISATYKV